MFALPTIDRRIICINGFTQTRYQRAGLFALWRHLNAVHAAPSCAVTLHPWDDDWRGFTNTILATGPREYMTRPPKILIVAYSWGVGYGAVTLARRLNGEGLPVQQLVSCDGVCRPAWLRWRALWSPWLGPPQIVLPPNIHRCDYLRQQENRPAGHEFRATNGTVMHDHGFVKLRHQEIDNCRQFFALAERAAADLMREGAALSG